ncbi:MAG: Gfo/Idh/MocA family oxidoreductase [Lachnospiraceae bacterium]|nr:Gfo/Idh/MocA family oxidoreductase [Lachnospiraceae bacterium]
MKVCFVGVGSIARRHIRNLHRICAKRNMDLCVDAYRRSGDPAEGVGQVYTEFSQLPNDYDVVFITNPTEFHLETLGRFHGKGKHFFIEKPIVSLHQVEQAGNFLLREDSVYYVACPLRYNAVIQYIKNHINPSDVISIRSISSSYLPDWRVGQDYRMTYSAHKDMGGGVSIDLIHEWDYLTYLFGWPKKVKSMIGKKSSLEIDSEDYAIYIAEYEDKLVELHLDYFGRKTIREIQLFTREDTIIGDISNNKIRFLMRGEEIDFYEERDDYQIRELEYFLDIISGRKKTDNHYLHGIKVLWLTQGGIHV